MSSSPQTTHLVLVADDEPSMLELVSRHLQSHSDPKLDVLEASDGEEAWQIARERLPDLVVLDVMMPGMSGWEVCRKIREDVALAHTGVVMLTGIGENLNQMTSPLYGADAYLDKPFDFEQLDAKVKQALEARATLRGAVSRPSSNGVAGPAKVASDAARKPGPKKASPRVALAKKSVSSKPRAKRAAVKKAPAKKAGGLKRAVKSANKAAKARLSSARKGPSKKASAKKSAKKAAAKRKR
jgi:DNA-binding response OmpR family regulator